MGDADELVQLRAQVRQLLAEALAAGENHDAQLQRRDDEAERRDKLHVDETGRRDELHIAETENRDELHQIEVQRRNEVHEHELEVIRAALESRDTIGQAKGIIMATMACTSDEAFALIRTQSQHENRKLADVAIDIVQRAARRPRTSS